MKFFLSHSSKDKDLVGKVYSALGPSLCHYDIATFDNADRIADEIYRAMGESTHYVLFASDDALGNENWVSGELKIAEDKYLKGEFDKVFVFIINDVDRDKIPKIFKNHVAVEHPSASHIAQRILSEVDEFQSQVNKLPDLYRSAEKELLEEKLTVESALLPKAILVCGSDGFGRKQLINEVYKTCFSGVLLRKFYIYFKEYESDYDLYKKIIHLDSLKTAKEINDSAANYEKLGDSEKWKLLAEKIVLLTRSDQVLVLEAHDDFFSESGRLLPWIEGLVNCLPGYAAPKLVLISGRKPYRLGRVLENSIHQLNLLPLDRKKSTLLLKSWLRKHEIEFHGAHVEEILNHVEGNNRLIKIAAESFKGGGDYHRLKSDVYSDLENDSIGLLRLKEKFDEKLVISFVAECGSIDPFDLVETLTKVGYEPKKIYEAINYLMDFGFIIQDSVSYKIPVFLMRAAKKFHSDATIKESLNNALKILVELINTTTESFDSETSINLLSSRTEIAVLQDYGNAINNHLRPGVSASLYYRTARKYYDNREYSKSYDLCDKAFFHRPQLTNEGSIEVLRIKGLAAARLGNKNDFDSVIKDFTSLDETKKSKRIELFLKGFNSRLDGLYDEALLSLRQAYESDGQNDYHILRELSNIHMLMGDLQNARKFIDIAKTKPYMRENAFILDIEIKIMLAGDEKSIQYNSSDIDACINKLRSIDNGNFSNLLKTEFDMILSDKDGALRIANALDTDSPARCLLKSKALIKARKFHEAEKILTALVKGMSETNKGQRMSIFPVVVFYLIDATSVRSLSDAVNVFKKYFRFVPCLNREQIKRELSSSVTEQTRLSSEQRRIISISE